jgi:tRNA (cmo5U34)-methyltransferase
MGAAARVVLDRFPESTAILAEYSLPMIREGTQSLAQYEGRFSYVEFDMLAGEWPDEIPSNLDAVVTSLCIHHLPDDRKQGVFVEIFDRLVPGGWYFNYDPVIALDPVVAATWQHTSDRHDP